MNDHPYNFSEQLKMSHGIALSFDFRVILLSEIPGAIDIQKSGDPDDRSGTDWWVIRRINRSLSIDLKARDKDFGQDDLALETWSVIETGKVGWTRDENKATDYILWFWNDTKRWCLIPFPMLCRVFILNWEKWLKEFKSARQKTDAKFPYHSECVFVPRKIVWVTIINYYSRQTKT